MLLKPSVPVLRRFLSAVAVESITTPFCQVCSRAVTSKRCHVATLITVFGGYMGVTRKTEYKRVNADSQHERPPVTVNTEGYRKKKWTKARPEKNYLVFRDSSQFITQLSASLRGRRCIFKQVKTEQEAHNERFFSAGWRWWNTNSPQTTSN